MRRRKAVAVAFLLAFAWSAGVSYADEWDWLRFLCAPWHSTHPMYQMLGCYQLPENGSPQGS